MTRATIAEIAAMGKRAETITSARLDLYDDLNDAGKKYVDALVSQISAHKPKNLGRIGQIELVMAIMQHCWNGELPK